MRNEIHFRGFSFSVALAVLLAGGASGAQARSRIISADFDRVWTAAVEVAREGFQADRIDREQGKLSFRTAPFYGYRLDVGVEDLGRTKTRIVVELRRNYARKFDGGDARRCRDRYLDMVSKRVLAPARRR